MSNSNKEKNHRNKLYSLFLGILLSLVSMLNTAYANTLKVCYDQWAPMTIFASQDSSDRGVVIDMLELIYTAKGYQLEYYEVPLARGLNMVAEGFCDMLPEYLYSTQTERSFEYASEPTFTYTSAFVVRKNESWRYEGIQSITGKRLATGPGWDYSSMSVDYQRYIDDLDNANTVEVIAGDDDVVERIFRMISEGRVDLYADNLLVLQYTLERLNLQDELKIVRPGLEKNLVERPIFSLNIPTKQRQALIKIWNEGRVSIKGDQEKRLLEKYHVEFVE